MKRKITLIALLLSAFVLLFSSCGEIAAMVGTETDSGNANLKWSISTAYKRAQDLGFEGTLEEFLAMVQGADGSNGADGIGIVSAHVNGAGDLILTLTNGAEINAGSVYPIPDPANGLAYVVDTDDNAVTIKGRGLCTSTNVIIPSILESTPVRYIAKCAFAGDENVKAISIPSSMEKIDDYAFDGCCNLKSIRFQGTKAEWEAIEKESYWDYGTDTYVVYCTDGNISTDNSLQQGGLDTDSSWGELHPIDGNDTSLNQGGVDTDSSWGELHPIDENDTPLSQSGVDTDSSWGQLHPIP